MSGTPACCKICGNAIGFDPVDPVRGLFRCHGCRQMITQDGSAWLRIDVQPRVRHRRRWRVR